jgi:hypothetical protein
MQMAADLTQTTMVSVIGLESDKVAELCKAASEKSGTSVSLAPQTDTCVHDAVPGDAVCVKLREST